MANAPLAGTGRTLKATDLRLVSSGFLKIRNEEKRWALATIDCFARN
jgi:hypothetical protein